MAHSSPETTRMVENRLRKTGGIGFLSKAALKPFKDLPKAGVGKALGKTYRIGKKVPREAYGAGAGLLQTHAEYEGKDNTWIPNFNPFAGEKGLESEHWFEKPTAYLTNAMMGAATAKATRKGPSGTRNWGKLGTYGPGSLASTPFINAGTAWANRSREASKAAKSLNMEERGKQAGQSLDDLTREVNKLSAQVGRNFKYSPEHKTVVMKGDVSKIYAKNDKLNLFNDAGEAKNALINYVKYLPDKNKTTIILGSAPGQELPNTFRPSSFRRPGSLSFINELPGKFEEGMDKARGVVKKFNEKMDPVTSVASKLEKGMDWMGEHKGATAGISLGVLLLLTLMGRFAFGGAKSKTPTQTAYDYSGQNRFRDLME